MVSKLKLAEEDFNKAMENLSTFWEDMEILVDDPIFNEVP